MQFSYNNFCCVKMNLLPYMTKNLKKNALDYYFESVKFYNINILRKIIMDAVINFYWKIFNRLYATLVSKKKLY